MGIGLGGRKERARQLVEGVRTAIAEREARLAYLRANGLRESRCCVCEGVMGEYLGVIELYITRCRHCGTWNELMTVSPE